MYNLSVSSPREAYQPQVEVQSPSRETLPPISTFSKNNQYGDQNDQVAADRASTSQAEPVDNAAYRASNNMSLTQQNGAFRDTRYQQGLSYQNTTTAANAQTHMQKQNVPQNAIDEHSVYLNAKQGEFKKPNIDPLQQGNRDDEEAEAIKLGIINFQEKTHSFLDQLQGGRNDEYAELVKLGFVKPPQDMNKNSTNMDLQSVHVSSDFRNPKIVTGDYKRNNDFQMHETDQNNVSMQKATSSYIKFNTDKHSYQSVDELNAKQYDYTQQKTYQTLNTVTGNQVTSVDQASQNRHQLAQYFTQASSGLYQANNSTVNASQQQSSQNYIASHQRNMVPACSGFSQANNKSHQGSDPRNLQSSKNEQQLDAFVKANLDSSFAPPAVQTAHQPISNVFAPLAAQQSGGAVNASAQRQVNGVPAQHLVRNQVSHFNTGNHAAPPQFQTPLTSQFSTAGNTMPTLAQSAQLQAGRAVGQQQSMLNTPSTSLFATPSNALPTHAQISQQQIAQPQSTNGGYYAQGSAKNFVGGSQMAQTGVANNQIPPAAVDGTKPARPSRRKLPVRKNKDGNLRKQRYCFSYHQKKILIDYFYHQGVTKPSKESLEYIANELQADARTVNVWFKNERQIAKHHTSPYQPEYY